MELRWLVTGLLLPFVIYSLPPSAAVVAILAGLALVPARRHHAGLAILLAACAWTSWHIDRQQGRWQRFETPQSRLVQGRVASLPVARDAYLEFQLRVQDSATDLDGLRVLVRWYRLWPDVRAGERWQLKLRLKPARSRVNFDGRGREPWFFANRIAALGHVEDSQNQRLDEAHVLDLLAVRDRLSSGISRVLDGHPALPTIVTLAVADRRLLDEVDWQRFNGSGTAHLLAISGLHIGIAAGLGWWLGRCLMWLMPMAMVLRAGLTLCWALSLLTALAYASLSGLPPSTLRALVMLGCVALVDTHCRDRSPWQILLMALACVLLMDPLAPLSAALYLSFGAVAALAWAFSGRPAGPSGWRVLLRAQAAMLLFSLPVGMMLFQRASPGAFLSNFVAIPWASMLVVPPVVFGTFLQDAWPGAAAFLVILAAGNMQILAKMLDGIASLTGLGLIRTHSPGWWALAAAGAAGVLLLLPRGFKAHAGALALLLPLFMKPEVSQQRMRTDLLDTGQGFAALVRNGRELMLYDSGPGDGRQWSLVDSVIDPAVQAYRGGPGRIVISHADLDHAGGYMHLMDRYPGATYHVSFPAGSAPQGACKTGQQWHIGLVRVRVLHPRPGLPYLGNDSSCVLSVAFGNTRQLLTGDISRTVEQRLLMEGIDRHEILFAAHHGSNSSSSPGFISGVRPEIALVSAASHNRYNFPHPDVKSRFGESGARLWSTSECGGLRIDIDVAGGAEYRSARRLMAAPWRWPAAPSCP